jgi:hypothetical protein
MFVTVIEIPRLPSPFLPLPLKEPDPRWEWLEWPLAWTYDAEAYDFNDLQTHLWSAAGMMAKEAESRHSDGTRLGKHIAALSMGTAVELLAKAFLVGINPALIAHQGDINSALIFSGEVEYLPKKAAARTRMGNEVLTAVRKMLQIQADGVAPWEESDQETVLEARNATAHLGLLRDDQKIDFMVCGRRILRAIVARSDELGEFWGARAPHT